MALYLLNISADGHSDTLPYESYGTCRNSTIEYFVESINRCCSKCSPGTRRKTECTTVTDTGCEKCQDGMYTGFNYYPNCFRCSKCDAGKGLEYKKVCTRESDALCVCKPGWFCTMDYEAPVCSQCKKYKQCPAGKGAKSPGKPDSDIQCDFCPEGTFSNESSSLPCKPHTRCDLQGKSVLQSGTSTKDTICGPSVIITTRPVTAHQIYSSVQTTEEVFSPTVGLTTSLPSATNVQQDFLTTSTKVSPSHVPGENTFLYWIGLAAFATVVILLLLIVAAWNCHRKGILTDTLKPAVNGASATGQGSDPHGLYSPVEHEFLISEGKTDPSTSSSDSHSQSTGISQDCNHVELPSVSNQCVNLSFTATFNCQVNPSSGTCSIPISPCMQPVEDEFPLSEEEELCMSSQEEDGKCALPSVQESEMTVLKVSESPPTSLYCQR
ncbi:tumor necrosis factor receptor superfamily member 1B [Trichomycterus rosablanca]|uniref:tumor necrosis factor receptor superfamily member 1B n=1 Tax=Trichomycterus rosablanca TaxID=2290929 RepID=UPI002F355755